ncbi:MAG: PP0621 family protein [Burkholderiales bacterium]
MARLLFIFLVGFIAYFLIKSYFRKLNQPRRPPDATAGTDDKNDDKKMVRCAHCGVHAPLAESIAADGEFYCSKEHYLLKSKK